MVRWSRRTLLALDWTIRCWSEHSYLKDVGRAEYYSVTDQHALDAFQRLARLELFLLKLLMRSHI